MIAKCFFLREVFYVMRLCRRKKEAPTFWNVFSLLNVFTIRILHFTFSSYRHSQGPLMSTPCFVLHLESFIRTYSIFVRTMPPCPACAVLWPNGRKYEKHAMDDGIYHQEDGRTTTARSKRLLVNSAERTSKILKVYIPTPLQYARLFQF